MKKYAYQYSVEKMSKVLEVSKSGYYYWLKHPVSKRKLSDIRLVGLIREILCKSKSPYGCVRITDELRMEMGETVSYRRVARIIREYNLSRVKKRYKPLTTDSKHLFSISKNLLNQNWTMCI